VLEANADYWGVSHYLTTIETGRQGMVRPGSTSLRMVSSTCRNPFLTRRGRHQQRPEPQGPVEVITSAFNLLRSHEPEPVREPFKKKEVRHFAMAIDRAKISRGLMHQPEAIALSLQA